MNERDLEIAELKHEIKELKSDVNKLSADIKGLIEAWNTAKGMTSFVKWLSGLIIAGGIIWKFLIKGN
jgi:uncharacterized coiled-coil DUF342 family protein